MQQEAASFGKRPSSHEQDHPQRRGREPQGQPPCDLIVIGASAGGIEALLTLVGGLPAALPACLLIVQHLSPSKPSKLPTLLSRAGPLPARWAVSQMEIEPGTISVAPPDQHLLVRGRHLLVETGPREQRARPSINVLFRSAAHGYGSRVVGVLLSGLNADGAEGLLSIQQQGGVTIVQDPRDAAFPEMPRSALAVLTSDYILPVASIAPVLIQLATSALANRSRAGEGTSL